MLAQSGFKAFMEERTFLSQHVCNKKIQDIPGSILCCNIWHIDAIDPGPS